MELVINIRGGESYPIIIGTGMLKELPGILKEDNPNAKYIIITDSNVDKFHAKKFSQLMNDSKLKTEKIVLTPGEQTKDIANYNEVMQRLTQLGADRSSVIIALGGGVIGDIAGFSAATYMRGIRYVQVPTTLLSQVDSSIGGKTGVNLPQGKNLVGAFYHPEKVIIDLDTLDTLSEEELRNGMVELVKHSIIRDKELFYYIRDNLQGILDKKKDLLKEVISESLKIKKKIVEEDEREKGVRKLLNYGHTFGHAIESLNNYKISHGRAVCAGMILAAKLSNKLSFIKDDELKEHNNLLNRVIRQKLIKIKADSMINEMKKDKKRIGDKLNLVLLKGVGNAFITSKVPEDRLREVLEKWL